jgi:hypothetical protein
MTKPSPFKNRPSWAPQPFKVIDGPVTEQIPESPGTIGASPAGSVHSVLRYHDGDGDKRQAVTAAVTQAAPAHTEDDGDVEEQQQQQDQREREEEEEEEQQQQDEREEGEKEEEEEEERRGREQNIGDSGEVLSGRQLDVLPLASPAEASTSDAIPEWQKTETVQLYRPRTQGGSQTTSPAEDTTGTKGGPRTIDITILSITGQRETASGLEYRCLGEVWLPAERGVPPDLLRHYRGQVAQQDRLATLRKRKRKIGEVDSVGKSGGAARKKVEQA